MIIHNNLSVLSDPTEATDRSKRPRLENHIIEVLKENTFEKGAYLLRKFPLIDGNTYYSDRVNMITLMRSDLRKTSFVRLYLSEICLPSMIVEDLVWLSKYVSIECHAKTNEVAHHYRSKITQLKVDIIDSVGINLVVSSNHSYLFHDDLILSVGSDVESTILAKHANIDHQKILLPGDTVYAFGKPDENTSLIDYCLKLQISVYQVLSVGDFHPGSLSPHLHTALNILVCDKCARGVFIVAANKDVSRLLEIGQGQTLRVTCGIRSLQRAFTGDLYQWAKLAKNIPYSDIEKSMFLARSGAIQPINIQRQLTITIEQNIETMERFLNREFDPSETLRHNQYCDVYEAVLYRFVLIPPCQKEKTLSNRYNKMSSCLRRFTKLVDEFNLNALAQSITRLGVKDNILLTVANQISSIVDYLKQVVDNTNYQAFYATFDKLSKPIREAVGNEANQFISIYDTIAKRSDDSKASKIDEEIQGIRELIDNLQSSQSTAAERIKNRKRIEGYEEEIRNLEGLRSQFQKESENRSDEQREAFRRSMLELANREVNSGSLSKVIKTSEATSETGITTILRDSIHRYAAFIQKITALCKEIASIVLPENHVLYTDGSCDFIAIEFYDEYVDAKKTADEFHAVIVRSNTQDNHKEGEIHE